MFVEAVVVFDFLSSAEAIFGLSQQRITLILFHSLRCILANEKVSAFDKMEGLRCKSKQSCASRG